MHIAEGVLSAPVLLAGAGLAALGIRRGLAELEQDRLVTTGFLAAVFFAGSLVHVPIGFASAHLLLNGLLGVLLGWAAFPAIFAALALQAALFQYGGFTTLGVNAFSMGFAAVISFHVFRWLALVLKKPCGLKIAAFCGGFAGVGIAALLTALALAFTAEGFRAAAGALLIAHLPVMVAEGLITMLAVGFIARVRPEMLASIHA